MKRIKKISTLLVALVMVLAMGVNAFADTTTTITNVTGDEFILTITPNDDDNGTHTYAAYQILKGTLALEIEKEGETVLSTKYILSDIQWGSGVSTEGQTHFGGDTAAKAREFAKSLTTANALEKAAELEQYLTTPFAISAPVTKKDATITGLAPGYYLVMDYVNHEDPPVDSPVSGPEDNTKPASKTRFILEVTKDTKWETAVKSSVPSVEKKTQDKNDSLSTDYEEFQVPAGGNLPSGTGDDAVAPDADDADAEPGAVTPTEETVTTVLIDSADYDIGHEIPYTVTATIGDGIEHYTGYSFQFVDTMSKGLSLVKTGWKVTVVTVTTPESGSPVETTEDITSLFKLPEEDPEANEDGSITWTWAADDIREKISAGSKVILTYSAILNNDAVIGAAGNPNTVKVVFDNDPNNCGKGDPKGDTPEDKNIIFTYKTVFNKVDKKGNPLPDADFELYKFIVNGQTSADNTGDEDNEAEPVEENSDESGSAENSETETIIVNSISYTGKWVKVTELHSGDINPYKVKSNVPASDTTNPEPDELENPEAQAPEEADNDAEGNENEGDEEGGAGSTTPESYTVFSFNGIDDGIYKLEETVTPPGYNTITPIIFQITAEHDLISDDPRLTDLTGTGLFENQLVLDLVASTIDGSVNGLPDGTLTADVVNEKGTILPSTGGIGRKFFFIGGGVLLVGAAILLIARHKMAAK